MPHDGIGALPLLRADAKSATYKLGFLQAFCRAANGAAGLAQEDSDDHIRLPFGWPCCTDQGRVSHYAPLR